MVETVTKDSLITDGLRISENFLLGHLTSGAYHPKIAQWLPIFSSKLEPGNFNNLLTPGGFPIWKVVKNLQMTSGGILESLFSQVGSDLILKAGYSLPLKSALQGVDEAMHALGLSIDIQVRSYEDNPFAIAKDIAQLASRASNINMTFGNSAWFHIETTPLRLQQSLSTLTAPICQTVDAVTGVVEKGLTSIRGLS